jgi:receptor protein-tyrosine kinase
MDLSEALWRAEGSTLSVLPVGKGTTTTADLYASPAMTRLLDELANRYPDRLIIFDAPPMLATNDPMVLSKQIRQVLLVVEAGKTTEATIRTALDVLGQRERVSLVLNHCTIKGDEIQSASYGYGSGVYHGEPAGTGRQKAA